MDCLHKTWPVGVDTISEEVEPWILVAIHLKGQAMALSIQQIGHK
jgi:hypothetical protein